MPKLPRLKGWALLWLWSTSMIGAASASAQVYWGQRAQPLPNPAPQIPQGPQPFRPNPYLGMQQQRPPNYFQPQQPAPQGSFNVMNMDNGTMKTCRAYGNQVSCF